MIFGVCTMHHVGFPALLFDRRNVEGRSEMRQVRKSGKSGREAILRVEKKHYKTVRKLY